MANDMPMVRVPAGIWTLGVSSKRTPYPIFSWGIGEFQNGDSPLWASAIRRVYCWEWPGQEPLSFADPDGVLAQIADHGFSTPPLIYEVGDVLSEFSPKMQGKEFEEMGELFAEIEQRWRELIRQL